MPHKFQMKHRDDGASLESSYLPDLSIPAFHGRAHLFLAVTLAYEGRPGSGFARAQLLVCVRLAERNDCCIMTRLCTKLTL